MLNELPYFGTTLLALYMSAWIPVEWNPQIWFAREKPEITAMLRTGGVEQRMTNAGIVRLQRVDDGLFVTMQDGSSKTAHVCAWNNEGQALGGCGRLTSSSGNDYVLTTDESGLQYRGDGHSQHESKSDFLAWIASDMTRAEGVANDLRDSQERIRIAAASWKE